MKILSHLKKPLTAAIAAATISFSTSASNADIPDRAISQINGIYKVAASNDPLFPVNGGQEWFLDFGSGLQTASSGTVVVSLRQNPNVSVQPMVWQFFPSESALAIGNQYESGSRQAVAKGVWTVTQSNDGIVFDREGVRFIVNRPAPGDY